MPLDPGIPSTDRDMLHSYIYRNRKERNRERDNWGIYDATFYGQWKQQNVSTAIQEGRSLSSYNLTKKNVDTTVGSITADPYELTYDTELGDENIYASLMNTLYLEDKDFMKYESQYWEFLRAGFVYKGYLQLYKDRRRDRRGRVGTRYIRGDYFITDPDVDTNDINDNKNIFVQAWMTAIQIEEKYDKRTPEIREAVKLYNNSQGGDAGTVEGDVSDTWDRGPEYWDRRHDLYLVIDRYWLVDKKYYEVYDPEIASVLATLPLDQAEVLRDSYKLQGKRVRLLEKHVQECRMRTTCPGLNLDLVLQEGPYEYQLGRYPFFQYSSDMINGKPNTYVDALADPQIQFNKRMNTATHILQTTSNNTLLIETDAVDDENEIDKIGKQRNRPGAYFKVTPGTISQNKIKHLEHGTPPTDFLNAASYVKEIFSELTPGVPSMQGVGERDESGVLYQSKVQQALISMQRPNKLLGVFWEEFGDAYFTAAKQTYTYPMLVRSSRTGEEIWLNIPGDLMSLHMAAIPRLKVNVSQSPSSETHRRQLLQSYLAVAQYLKDPYTLSELSRIVVGSLPGIPQAEQEQLKASAALSSEAQKVALMAQVASVKAQMAQMGQMGGGAPGMEVGTPIGENSPNNAPTDSQRLLESVTSNVQDRKNSMSQGVG